MGTSVLASNFILLKFKEPLKEFTYHEYYVRFYPPIDQLMNRKRILAQLQNDLGCYLYDGDTLFLLNPLKNKRTDLTGFNPYKDDEKVHVRLFLLRKYDEKLEKNTSNKFYNALMGTIYTALGLDETGNCFYDTREPFDMPQQQLQLCPGFATTVHHVEAGLTIRLDTAFQVKSTTTGLDILMRIRKDEDADLEQKKFKEFCIGRFVFSKCSNTAFKVDDVDYNRTPLSKFKYKGKMVSYADYCGRQHNVTLQETNQPLFLSKRKSYKKSFDGSKLFVSLIPELCTMLHVREDFSSRQAVLKEIVPYMSRPPNLRVSAINTFIERILSNDFALKLFEEWGLHFDPEYTSVLKIPGNKILPGPSLMLNKQITIKKAGVDFSKEVKTNTCFMPIPIKKYLVFCCENDVERGHTFIRAYSNIAQSMGICSKLSEGVVINVGGSKTQDLVNSLHKYKEWDKIQFVVAILASHSEKKQTYAAFKYFCLAEKGIPSQVICRTSLLNEIRVKGIIQKIAIQINCKLGGAPWALKFPMMAEKIMCIGMDVYHDPRGKNLSCAAFIATLNNECTKHFSNCFFQTPMQEIMEGLEVSFFKALKAYHKENGEYPQRILAYRDGVHSGQFLTVEKFEIPQLTRIIDELYGEEVEKHPKFTFIIVQKRINERFFLNKKGSYENPACGTVIDKLITRPNYYDFFLVSQVSVNGAVTPTRYVVFYDNSNIKPEFVQKFSFALSYMYFNWTGGVRIPAVCQYAHKLANLTGKVLHREARLCLETTLYYI